MDHQIKQVEPNVWEVSVGKLTHVIRFRNDAQTFAPWDVMDVHGRRVYSGFTFDGACRWILSRHQGTS